MTDGEATLSVGVLESAERRAVYVDWLLERGDPRGALIQACEALDASAGQPAAARAQARLDIVAALARVARWLDERVPEGRPWRSADTRGVTSAQLGFVSHERGVLQRFRAASAQATPVPAALFEAIPTVRELAVSTALGSLASLGRVALTHAECLDLELPTRAFAIDASPLSKRLEGLDVVLAARARPVEVRVSDGELEADAVAALLALPQVSLVWLDRARVPLSSTDEVIAPREPRVAHLRLVETPVSEPLVAVLAEAKALRQVRRFELKDWLVPRPALGRLMTAMPALAHAALLRCPLGIDLIDVLCETGRLAALETLEASGCLLAAAGVSRALRGVGPTARRLTFRFNQLTAHDVEGLARLPSWPACEVRFEEVGFAASAHQAIAALATAHRLEVHVSGCTFSVRPSARP